MQRCCYCKKPLIKKAKFCSKECAHNYSEQRTALYRDNVNKIRGKMHITSSNGAQEKRKCFNCGKEFISNTIKREGGRLEVRGEFTCCYECTQALIDRGEL